MDLSNFNVPTLKTMLKDEGLSQHHDEIKKVIAKKTEKPSVPADQKVVVDHKGFNAVVYLHKRYLSPVAYKGKRLFTDQRFGGSPVLYEGAMSDFVEFLAKVDEVFASHPIAQ